jgi:hypothetical protein
MFGNHLAFQNTNQASQEQEETSLIGAFLVFWQLLYVLSWAWAVAQPTWSRARRSPPCWLLPFLLLPVLVRIAPGAQ